MYVLAITNRIGLEVWNPYGQAFPYPLRIRVENDTRTTLSDSAGNPIALTNSFVSTNTTVDTNWLPGAFATIAYTNLTILPSFPRQEYSFTLNGFKSDGETEKNGFPIPDWQLGVTNRLLFLMYDPVTYRLVDCVDLSNLGHSTNIMSALQADKTSAGDVWNTNRAGASVFIPTEGIRNQMRISLGLYTHKEDNLWAKYYEGVTTFRDDLVANLNGFVYATNAGLGLVIETGFNPITRLYLTTTWQANDPLLHSMIWDLEDARPPTETTYQGYSYPQDFPGGDYNLSITNRRYWPWPYSKGDDRKHPIPFDLAVQDPMVRGPDDWDFPEGKLPNLGWLGRIHRGTPWQSVYLKAEPAAREDWAKQTTGAAAYMDRWADKYVNNLLTNPAPSLVETNRVDAEDLGWLPTHPTSDWRLADLFTVAPNANATRGTLSVNQPNLAAWSAVFGGIPVMTNVGTPKIEPSPATPATVLNADANFMVTKQFLPGSPELEQIVDGINRVRDNLPGKQFNRLSDVLAVPELSVNRLETLPNGTPRRSPFLFMQTPNPMADDQQRAGLTDAAYEALPAQVLSLLRVGEPRVVIYAYGQSLEPAGAGSVNNFGVPDNYRVTAEYATRSVVRFEFDSDRSDTNAVVIRPIVESFNVLSPH